MTVGEQEFQDRVSKIRTLSESEKIALICGQHYNINQIQDRVEQLKCAHTTGQCVLCKDKDKTIEEQQEIIKALRAKLYGRSSERRPKGTSDDESDSKKPKSATRTRLPSEQYPNAKIKDETITDPEPPQCPECKESMTDSGLRETSERLELIPMEIFIIRQHRVRYHCKCCQVAPQTAALPARLAPNSSLNDSVIIEAAIAKFYDLIPTERFAKMLSRSSVDISDKLVFKAQSVFCETFYPVYLKIKREILAARVVNADESPHRMLERNKGNYRWYLWCFCIEVAVYFEIHDTRAGTVSIEFLLQAKAVVLVCDVYSGYERTEREVNEYRATHGLPPLVLARCNDHARRYFIAAEEHESAQKIIKIYAKIYKIEANVQTLLKNPTYEEPENSKKALELRQTADPLFEQIYNISADILMDHSERTSIGQAANYFLKNLKGLTLFLTDLDIPISNAYAERSVRNPAVGRKTWLGTHSEKGARITAVNFTIFESCRINQLNPRDYCNFNKDRHNQSLPMLTPHEYKQLIQSKPPPNT